MCLALPARVISLDATGQSGQVDLGGVRKTVSFALLDEVNVGDHVIVGETRHYSFADEGEFPPA